MNINASDLGWDTPQPGTGYPLPLGPGTGTPPAPLPQTWDRVPPGPGMGYPPDLGWGTPPDLGWGTPHPTPDLGQGTPPDLGWGTPRNLRGVSPLHSEHLLRGRRYASCVHAGGLSCYILFPDSSNSV